MAAQLAQAQAELDRSQRRWSRGQEEWLGEVSVRCALCVLLFPFAVGVEWSRGRLGGLWWASLLERGLLARDQGLGVPGLGVRGFGGSELWIRG